MSVFIRRGADPAPRRTRIERCHRAGHRTLAGALLIACLCATAAGARQFAGEELRVEPLLEELRRDQWKGRPTSEELGSTPPGSDVLELTRDRGWLYAPRRYYDFILDYEMRLAARGRHRLFFRALNRSTDFYELRIESTGSEFKAEVTALRSGARNQRVPIPADRLRAAFAGREWHAMRVHAQGERVLLTANDTKLLDLDGLHNLGGNVGFAGQGVTFRAARVRARPAPEAFRTAYDPTRVEDLEAPEVLKHVPPTMPRQAYGAMRDYKVILEVVIDENGDVVAERFLRRFDEDLGYNDEAVRAVRQWKFKPARSAGKPVPVVVAIEVTFEWEGPIIRDH